MAIITLREYQNELNNLFASEAYDEVVGHCHHILQHYPKHVDTYRLLGNALLHSQHQPEATEVFRRILSSEPSDYAAHKGLSEIFEQQRNLNAAIWHMERIYDVYPNSGSVVSGIRRLYLIKDGREPDKVQMTRAALARQYMKGQLYDQAIAELNTALESNPQRYDLTVLLAEALYGAGYTADAGRTALEVLKHLPDCLPANALMVKLWLENKRPEDAKPFLERIESLSPYQSAALIAPNNPVSDDAYRIERLDWRTQRATSAASTSPDWMSDLTSTLSTAGTGPLVAPDWYAPGADFAPAAPTQPSTPAFATDDMEDWFGEIDRGTNDLPSLEDIASPPEPEPFDLFAGLDVGTPSNFVDDDIPLPDDALNWMADIPDFGESPQESSFDLPPMDDLFASPTSDSSPTGTGMTDFLSELNNQSDINFDSLFDDEPEPEQPGRLTQLFSGGEFGETGAISSDEVDSPQKASLTQLFDGGDFAGFDDVLDTPSKAEKTSLTQLFDGEDFAGFDDVLDELEAPSASEKASLTQLFDGASFEDFDDLLVVEEASPAHGRLTGLFESNDFATLPDDVDQFPAEQVETTSPPMDFLSDEDVPDWVREVDTLDNAAQKTAPAAPPPPVEEEPAWLHEEDSAEEVSGEWLYDTPQPSNEIPVEEQPESDLDAEWLRDSEPEAEAKPQITMPDWIGQAAEEPESEEKPAIVMPAWLNPVSEELPVEVESPATGWLRAPIEDQDDFENEPAADWLGVFGDEPPSTEALAEESMSLSDFNPEPATDDNDWMADFGELAQPEPIPASELPDWMNEAEPAATNDNDWMADFGEISEPEPAQSSSLPDWMNEAEPAATDDNDWMADFGEISEPEPAQSSALPDWMSEAEPAAATDDNDWMADFGETSQPEPAQSSALPDWMSEAEPAATDDNDWMADFGETSQPEPAQSSALPDWMNEAEPAAATDDNDWMADFGETSQPEPAQSSALPDWMSEAEPAAATDDNDWMADFGETSQPEPAQGSGLPDWMNEAEPAATDDNDWMADFGETTEPEPAQGSGLPDWMSEAEPAAATDDNDWMANFGETTEPEPAQSSALPDWMNETESAATDDNNWMADFGEISEPEPAQSSALPDWMNEAEPVTTDDNDWMADFGETSEPEPAQSSSLPDWLNEAEPATGNDNVWMSDFGETAQSEPVHTGELPDWLSSMEAEPITEAGEAVDFSDWLSEDAETANEAVEEGGNWLSDFGDEVEAAPAAGLPDWLAESQPTISDKPLSTIQEQAAPSDETGVDEYTQWVGGLAHNIDDEEPDEMDKWISGLAEDVEVKGDYTEWVGGLAHNIDDEEPDEMNKWISGLAEDVEVEDESDSYEPIINKQPALPPDMPEWLADNTVPAQPTAPLAADAPSWMTAFTGDEAAPVSNEVAQAGDMVDNWGEVVPEDSVGDFGFSYDFENVKPAWLRGDNDDDSETKTFTPPWMRGK